MKVYLAACESCYIAEYHKLFPDSRLNILIGYGSPASKGLDFMLNRFRDKIGSIMLDAGTYELNNGKKSASPMALTLTGYKTYLKYFGNRFNHYFNFDEDFSTEGMMTNLCNLEELEKSGLSPIPVVHDIYGDEIPLFIERGYKYIALGSSQITSKKHLEHVMRQFAGTEIKVHLFGNSSFEYLSNFPIYSCDSARWAHSTRNGVLYFWNHEKPGLNKTEQIILDRINGPSKSNTILKTGGHKEFINLIQDKFGIDIITLLSFWDYQHLINIHYMVELETAINKIQREEGFYTAE